MSQPSDPPCKPFELETGDIHPLIVKCIHKNATYLAEGLKELNVKIESKPDVITVAPLKSGTPEILAKQVTDLIHEYYSVKCDIKLPEQSLPEVTELITSLKETALFDFFFSCKGTVLTTAGSSDAMTQFDSSFKDIMNGYIQSEEVIELSHREYCYTRTVIMEELNEKFRKVLLVQDPSTSTLKVSGSVTDLKAFSEYFKKAMVHKCVDANFSPLLVQYFHTPGGQSKLMDCMESGKIGVYFHSSPLKLALLCEPSRIEATRGIINYLKRVTAERVVPLSESFQLIRKELTDFKDYCEGIQRSNQVLVIPGDKCIEIVGLKEATESCKEILAAYVEKKSKIKKDVKIEKGPWKLFTSHMKAQWDSIVSRSKELKVEIRQVSGTDHPHFSLHGDRVHVDSLLRSIVQLKSSIHKKVIPIHRPGTGELFNPIKGRAKPYLDSIEFREKVAIEIRSDELEEHSDEELSLNPNIKFIPKCSAFINSVKIDVCLGDITEFEVDVIVNAANEQLSHRGGVAMAIASKGGPTIQEDCTRYVRKSGKVNTGDIWLTTNTGNLHCKALIHAVGPVWSNGKQKEEALLYSVCKKSLSQSRKYHSIAFPAISSGIYKFPIKLCASTMINAVMEFAKEDLTASLKEITFMLLPTQVEQCNVFISKLQECLPSDKIQLHLQGQQESSDFLKVSPAKKPLEVEKSEAVFDGSSFNKVKLRQGSLLDTEVKYTLASHTCQPQHCELACSKLLVCS